MSQKKSEKTPANSRLVPLDLDWEPESTLPDEVETLLANADVVLQGYWDSWHRKPIEQYVACDFRDVWRALKSVTDQELADGRLFCEWGCGFGIVTGLASKLGWDAVGIEAEPFLVDEARRFLNSERIEAEIWQGNFLPPGSEKLARSQANHASLFHQVPCAYQTHDLALDDFAMIFAYPWPGEDYFLKEVFSHYARPGALLLLFLGPYEIELYRKTESVE